LATIRSQGRSIRWFCDQMGCSRYAFWRIEEGRSGAPVDWYERSAEILGVLVENISPFDNGGDLAA
jgi:hypothetical protein